MNARTAKRVWDRAGKRVANLSIAVKTAFISFALIVIPITVASLYLYSRSTDQLFQSYYEAARRAAIGVKASAEQALGNVARIAQNVAFEPALRVFLLSQFELNPDSLDVLREVLNPLVNAAANDPAIQTPGVYIFTSNESIPEGWGKAFQIANLTIETWYQRAAEPLVSTDIVPVSSVDLLESDPAEPGIAWLQPIRTDSGNRVGLLVLTYQYSTLFTAFEDYGQETLGFLVMGRSGEVLYERGTALDDSELDWVLGGTEQYTYLANTLLIREEIQGTDWVLVHRSQTSDLNRQINGVIRQTIILSLVSSLMLVGIVQLVLRAVMVRIRRMTRVLDLAIHSDQTLTLPVKRNDEIGELARDFNSLIRRTQQLIKTVAQKESAHKDAQLLALQYQINPHFLHNTLEVFRSELETAGRYAVADAISDFSEMVRYNMISGSSLASVREEIDQIRRYIKIENLQHGDRLVLEVEIPDEIQTVRVLRFMIQPVVENSIRHGVRKGKQLRIIIGARLMGTDELEIVVEDDGLGIQPEELQRLNNRLDDHVEIRPERELTGRESIGLSNINGRIRLHGGERGSIRIESELDRFTRTIIRLPTRVADHRRGAP